ncbi:hypothetical protein LCGC14_3007150, partial [marine sediment metagenome]
KYSVELGTGLSCQEHSTPGCHGCEAPVRSNRSSREARLLRSRGTQLCAEDTRDAVTIVTGPMRLVVPKKGFRFPGQVWLDRKGNGTFTKITNGGDAFVKLRGKINGTFRASKDSRIKVELEAAGPVRATVRVSGRYVSAGRRANRWIIRLHAFAVPLETDECNYAYIGSRLLAGDRLYLDVWDHHL